MPLVHSLPITSARNTIPCITRSKRSYNPRRRNAVAYNQSKTCTGNIDGLIPHPIAYMI